MIGRPMPRGYRKARSHRIGTASQAWGVRHIRQDDSERRGDSQPHQRGVGRHDVHRVNRRTHVMDQCWAGVRMKGECGWIGEVRPWTCGFTEAALETMKTMIWPLSASSKNQGPTVLAQTE